MLNMKYIFQFHLMRFIKEYLLFPYKNHIVTFLQMFQEHLEVDGCLRGQS